MSEPARAPISKPVRIGGLAVLAALVVVAVVVWWRHTYVLVEHQIDLPPRGEASYNPLYALKLALRADGVRATSRQTLDLAGTPLRAHDTVLVFNDPRTLSNDDVATLLDWVEGGGHLLVRVPPPERGIEAVREGQLLPALGLRPLPDREACTRFAVGGARDGVPHHGGRKDKRKGKRADGDAEDADDVEPLFCDAARFTMDGVEPRLSWGDLDAGYVYARLAVGDGVVDVLADFAFLANDRLDKPGNAAFVRRLLQPNWKRDRVHLVYAASMPPLWRLLLQRAWMAWLPLALAIAAWLWMRTQRFGPLRPAPEAGRRALLEHVQASGEHLWRYGRAQVLHAALRDAFLARLRRRDPLAAALDGRAQAAAIAARTGLAEADVAHALQTPKPQDGAEFRLRITRLIQMRLRL